MDTITDTIKDTITDMIMAIHRNLWQLKKLIGINMMIIITTMAMTMNTVTTMGVKRKRDALLLRCSVQKAGIMEMPSQRCTRNLDLSLIVNISVLYPNRRLIPIKEWLTT